jgi:hypothetical protein
MVAINQQQCDAIFAGTIFTGVGIYKASFRLAAMQTYLNIKKDQKKVEAGKTVFRNGRQASAAQLGRAASIHAHQHFLPFEKKAINKFFDAHNPLKPEKWLRNSYLAAVTILAIPLIAGLVTIFTAKLRG